MKKAANSTNLTLEISGKIIPSGSVHHRTPRSAGGGPGDTEKVDPQEHTAFHILFGSLHPCEIGFCMTRWSSRFESFLKIKRWKIDGEDGVFIAFRKSDNTYVFDEEYTYNREVAFENGSLKGKDYGTSSEIKRILAYVLLFWGMSRTQRAKLLTRHWVDRRYEIHYVVLKK